MALRTIVLPGLDGAADLRAEFVAALAPEFDASVLAYSVDAPTDYDALAVWVRERLPADEQFLLIAESFSGPLAIRIAASRPPGLVGLVLAASFARAPRPILARLAAAIPLRKPPMSITMQLLMGRWSTHDWKARLSAALDAVTTAALRRRLMAAASVDVSALIADIDCPILFLQATHDRVVPRQAWLPFRERGHNAVCIGIEGPHMLLQAKPVECAEAVKR